MANLITVGRLILLFIVVAMIYRGSGWVIGLAMIFVAVVIAGDGLDGYVARRRGSTSQFGAVFDIAGDRVVEQAFWIVFAHLGVIGVWVPLLVVTRGSLVDALRSLSYSEGMTAFGERNMMRSSLTQWLTAGRFMRGLYGYAKGLGFVFLTGEVGFKHATSGFMADLYDSDLFRFVGWSIVWLAVALLVIRGLPVVFDALPYMNRKPLSNAAAGRTPVAPPAESSTPARGGQ